MLSAADITVAIPTFGRDKVLVDTIGHLAEQSTPGGEILVIDQTPDHDAETERALEAFVAKGDVRWIRQRRPSITGAMNRALREASGPIVLFVDDDIVPAPGLIEAHAAAYKESEDTWAVTGQVLQLGEEAGEGGTRGEKYSTSNIEHPTSNVEVAGGSTLDPLARRSNGQTGAKAARPSVGLREDLGFPFNSTKRAWVKSVMAGNLSVRRDRALAIGGFDEQFIGVAYRFETEFCRRVWKSGGKVLFEPTAGIRHLRETSGGTRRFGNHLTSPSPTHGVGDYYFALRCGKGFEAVSYMLRRPFREICTRFHFRHPWYIPGKFVGEILALCWALGLAARGPKYASDQ